LAAALTETAFDEDAAAKSADRMANKALTAAGRRTGLPALYHNFYG
jgi:hypothetical protein